MENERQCWICYLEECPLEDGFSFKELWVSPCLCHGTTKWVHKKCILEWIERRQNGNPLYNVSCSQCKHNYIVTQKMFINKYFRQILMFGRKISEKISIGFVICETVISVYSVCFFFGTITVFLCIGFKETLEFFYKYSHRLCFFLNQTKNEFSNGFSKEFFRIFSLFMMKIMVGIPLIPILLLSLCFWRLRWFYILVPIVVMYETQENISYQSYSFVLVCLPFYVIIYQKIKQIIPIFISKIIGCKYSEKEFLEEEVTPESGFNEILDNEATLKISALSIAKVIAFPLVSSIVGFVLFQKTSVKYFHRTLFGGALFILSKDILFSIYKLDSIYSKTNRGIFCNQRQAMQD